MHTHTDAHLYIQIHLYILTAIHNHTHTNARAHTHTHTHMHTQMHTCTYSRTHSLQYQADTYTQTRAHTHTLTHNVQDPSISEEDRAAAMQELQGMFNSAGKLGKFCVCKQRWCRCQRTQRVLVVVTFLVTFHALSAGFKCITKLSCTLVSLDHAHTHTYTHAQARLARSQNATFCLSLVMGQTRELPPLGCPD